MGQNPLLTHFKPISGFSRKPTFQPVQGGWKLFSKKGPEAVPTRYKAYRGHFGADQDKFLKAEFSLSGFRSESSLEIVDCLVEVFIDFPARFSKENGPKKSMKNPSEDPPRKPNRFILSFPQSVKSGTCKRGQQKGVSQIRTSRGIPENKDSNSEGNRNKSYKSGWVTPNWGLSKHGT